VFTASPITPVWVPSPTAPDTTSPLFTPIRSWREAEARSDRRANASSISSAASTARSGSSSWVMGAPKMAMMASPMNFSTTPPRDSTAPVSSANVSVTSPRSSSGSRCSASVEKPTRSAKSTVTRRRSLGISCGDDASLAAVSGSTGWPHEPQNRNPGGISAPQLEQTWAAGRPQEPQNRNPSGFSKPQCAHRIGRDEITRRGCRPPGRGYAVGAIRKIQMSHATWLTTSDGIGTPMAARADQ
jgi:hypothetical protein